MSCFRRTEHVPVMVGFGSGQCVGEATVEEDGSADVRLEPGSDISRYETDVSIGYQVIRSRFDQDRLVVEEAEAIDVRLLPKQEAKP